MLHLLHHLVSHRFFELSDDSVGVKHGGVAHFHHETGGRRIPVSTAGNVTVPFALRLLHSESKD